MFLMNAMWRWSGRALPWPIPVRIDDVKDQKSAPLMPTSAAGPPAKQSHEKKKLLFVCAASGHSLP